MHQWTTELLAHLAAGRAELCDAMAATAPADRERRPGAGRWSVANVLSHLARTEGQVAALLQRGARAVEVPARAPAVASGAPSIVWSFAGARVLDRSERVDAPAFAQPELALGSADAARALARARRRLEDLVIKADGVDMRPVCRAHFLFGELDFYQWVAFAGFHERRHTAQLHEIAAVLAAPR